MVFPQLVFDFFDYKIGCTYDVDVGVKLLKSIFFIMQFNGTWEIHILSNISDSIIYISINGSAKFMSFQY